MDFFLPFMGVLGSQALLSARNIFGADQTSNKTTSTENASTYQDPWSDSSIGSSGSDKPASATMTSEKEHCANSDTGAAKKQNKDPKTTHIGADISASRSDESKVTTDRKHATSNSDGDEMILDCITVKPEPSDSDIEITSGSSPTDTNVSTIANSHIDPASASTQDLLQAIAAAAMDVLDTQPTDTGSTSRSSQAIFSSLSPSLFQPVTAAVEAGGPAGNPSMRRKWAGPVKASLYDTPSSPADYEPVAGSPKKRKWAAPMAASLFDVIHSPSPKKRLIRSPTSTMTDFSFITPPRTPTATENVDPQGDTQIQTPSKIRLRLTFPTPMAAFNRLYRTSAWEPELTDEDMEKLKAGESVDKRPKPQTTRRRIRQRTSDKTWDELSVVDKKGFLNTWTNQRNSTGTPRRKLQECKWARYREPEINVLMPGVDGRVPKLVLTDPEGRHYLLEDLRFPTQRALPGI